MECYRCHLIFKKEDTKIFTCNHIICNLCFCNSIIKELINNITDIYKTYSIECKCKKGTLPFNLDNIKKIIIPLNSEESRTCPFHSNQLFTHYDKTIKTLLCDKCLENDEFKNHEKLKISDLKSIIKEKISDLEYKTYSDFKIYIKNYLNKFIQNCKEYYQKELGKIEILVEKLKKYEQDLKKQMESTIEKESILFDLIDKIYDNHYHYLKIFNENFNKEEKYGYRFYKQLSKIKFNFGEFGIEYQEEIIPEIENMINDFDKNLSNKTFKTSIKYPYFELIKRFTQINDIKQESIISCLAENRKSNEIFVGYRDYIINVLRPKNIGYEIAQTLKSHKGEITTLLYFDDYLISGSKDRTIRIWKQDFDNNYKIKQIITLEKEINKINKYTNKLHIGFLATGEESNFRLFLKNDEKLEEEKEGKKEEPQMEEEKEGEDGLETGNENLEKKLNLKKIFKVEQVLSDHDNEVREAIQIKGNNDIVSGSKDMTIIIWKDFMNSLQYELSQLISAGNEVEDLCQFGNKGFAYAVNGSYEIKIYELNFIDGKYENIATLSQDFCHDRMINQIILLKDNRLASCSYDSTVKILSYNSLTKELREDQELDEQNLPVNAIIETGNGKLITGGHGKHLMIYKRN